MNKNDVVALVRADQSPENICGFRLKVKMEKLEEYVQAHQAVWPEMREALSKAGWTHYSLFLDPSAGDVFGYFEAEDVESAFSNMEADPVNTKWQETMAEYFVQPDGGVSDVMPQYFYLK